MNPPTISNPPPTISAASRLVQLATTPQSGGCNCGATDTQEVDAGLCPIPTLQFPRFFAGQLVQPADLTAIEQRIFSHEQLRARHLIGWGISCGFRVAIDSKPADVKQDPLLGSADYEALILKGAMLRVEAGYGLDRYGRDVYMAQNYSVSLEQLFAERQARITKAMGDPWCAIPGCQPEPPTHYCVAVRYKECLDQPVPSYAQQCGTPKTICEYSRVSECIEIRLFGDNEFPELPKTTNTQTWCGLPRQDLSLAALWAAAITLPQGATDVASTIAAPPGSSGTPAGTPIDAYTLLATYVSGEADERQQPSCLDLLHAARACEPCVAWPWIPLACFSSDGQNVTAPDCRVRRTIYSLQEIETAVVRMFCALLEVTRRLGEK
jgi:hypothetical protein